MKRPLIWLIKKYQRHLSPQKPSCCRFIPTCSNYGLEAIERWRLQRRHAYLLFRILRCNPFCKGGYDPVPQKKEKRSHK